MVDVYDVLKLLAGSNRIEPHTHPTDPSVGSFCNKGIKLIYLCD